MTFSEEENRILDLLDQISEVSGEFSEFLLTDNPPFPFAIENKLTILFEIDVYFIFQLSFCLARTKQELDVGDGTMSNAFSFLQRKHQKVSISEDHFFDCVEKRLAHYGESTKQAILNGDHPMFGWAPVLQTYILMAMNGDGIIQESPILLISDHFKKKELENRILLAQLLIGEKAISFLVHLFEEKDYRLLTKKVFLSKVKQGYAYEEKKLNDEKWCSMRNSLQGSLNNSVSTLSIV